MKPLPPKLRQALLYQLRDTVQQRPDALPPHGVPNIEELRERERLRFQPPNKATPGTQAWEDYYPTFERRST